MGNERGVEEELRYRHSTRVDAVCSADVARVAETILGCAARFCNSPHLTQFAAGSGARQKLPCRAKRWPVNALQIERALARGSLAVMSNGS